jgi:hypothetical protein
MDEVSTRVTQARQKALVDGLLKRAVNAEEQLDAAQARLNMMLQVESQAKQIRMKRKKNLGRGEVTAVMVASDWHLEETIEPGTVGGLNSFNLQIAEARALKFFQKSLFLLDGFSKFLNLKHAVLALLGDLISGHLHEENLEENSLSPTQAVTFAFERLRAGIRLLLADSPCETLDIVCASGNHGRTTIKPRASTRTKHSFENLLYRFLEREFAHEPRVRFILEEGYHVWHEVAGRQIRFHHGDELRYHGGVGGLYIPVGKAIASWNRARPAYLDVFGHWHTNLDGGSFICNGSLVGYNAYAVKIKANYELPQQQFFLVDREHGKIATLPLFVGE